MYFKSFYDKKIRVMRFLELSLQQYWGKNLTKDMAQKGSFWDQPNQRNGPKKDHFGITYIFGVFSITDKI